MSTQSSSSQSIEVRGPRSAAEWFAIRELCCRTGANGKPIDRARWPFFSEHWIGPYQKLRPRWTYAAVVGGRVRGYLTGCPSTRRFEFERRLFFDPWLAARVVLRRFPKNRDTSIYLKRLLRIEKAPRSFFDEKTLDAIENKYPAHLHINVDEECRGWGLGRLLIDCFVSELRGGAGVAGLHVFCGPDPVRFYESVGFEVLSRIEFGATGSVSKTSVYAMGRET